MKKRLKNILLGIKDGCAPNVEKSVNKDEQGKVQVNVARLISAVLSFLVMIAGLTGLIPWEKALAFLKMLLMAV